MAGGALAGALLLAGASPAGAQQRDSVRVRIYRAVTPFEIEVERLSRRLLEQRSQSVELANMRQRLLSTLERLAEGERAGVANSLRTVEARLATIETDRVNLRRALDELCSERRQPDGWMGVNFTSQYSVSSTRDGYGLTHFKDYPSIESVEPNSPAERAGIQRGDLLLSLAGRDLQDAEIVFGEMLKPGARLALKLKRGVETKTVSVLVERRPEDFEVPCAWVDDVTESAMRRPLPRVAYRVPPPGTPTRVIIRSGERNFDYAFSTSTTAPGWAAGAQIIPLNRDLARLTEVDQGVFVVEVISRTPAAQSGLRGGDVIVSAGGRPVSAPQMLRQLMEQSETKEIQLQVVRMKKGQTIVLKW